MNSSNIEDAIVIHLLYSLFINLITIAILSFDFIDVKKILTLFNTKISSFATVKRNDHLYGDLKYFRELKKNGIMNVQNETSYLNKIKIKGDFITTLASTGIFLRLNAEQKNLLFRNRINENALQFYVPNQCILPKIL